MADGQSSLFCAQFQPIASDQARIVIQGGGSHDQLREQVYGIVFEEYDESTRPAYAYQFRYCGFDLMVFHMMQDARHEYQVGVIILQG